MDHVAPAPARCLVYRSVVRGELTVTSGADSQRAEAERAAPPAPLRATRLRLLRLAVEEK